MLTPLLGKLCRMRWWSPVAIVTRQEKTGVLVPDEAREQFRAVTVG